MALNELFERLETPSADTSIEDAAAMLAARDTLKAMLEAMHEVDRYCNTIRTNYRSGSMEEQIASTVKGHIRGFLR